MCDGCGTTAAGSGSAATGLLGVAELADRAGVPAETVRAYAEDRLLPPARRGADGSVGYGAAEARRVRFLAGAEQLGLELREVAVLHDGGDRAAARRRMTELVTAALSEAQAALAAVLRRQADAGGVAAFGDTSAMRDGAALAERAGRLQALEAAMSGPAATGDCTEECACVQAVTAPAQLYAFPTSSAVLGTPAGGVANSRAAACDLEADGGDMVDRTDRWRAVLVRATGRESIDDGVAVTFDHDVDLAAQLGGLLAAEHRCCGFATYSLVIDARAMRAEIRTPSWAPEARLAIEALFGTPA